MFFKRLSRKRKTIGFRLAAWYCFVFILSSLALFGLSYFLLSSSLHRNDRDITESELKLYASRYQSEGLQSLIGEVSARHRESLFVRVVGPGGETLFQNTPTDWDDFDVTRLQARGGPGGLQWTYLTAEDEGELLEDPDQLEVLSLTLSDGAVLQVGKSPDGREEVLESFRDIFALVMFAVLGIGLAGGALAANRSLRPVRDLAAVLRSIRKTGKMNSRAPTRETGDELDEMAVSFNALLETIESLINRMRSSLDNIAHDLRTPLTRMRVTAEAALRSDADAQTCKEALADCLEEAEHTVTMLNALMDVAEAEAGAMKLELEQVALPELIGSVVGLYEHVAEDKGVALHSALPKELSLRADPRRIRQAVANLLDNAIKYTPEGGRVEVEAGPRQQQVMISVKDTGIGIQPEELPKIWDRLYRGEASHLQRGLGLGLSLVRAVVLAHKGFVEARSEPGQGSQFVIYLPAGSAS